MNALAVPFRQLMERRLWPLALILAVAIPAVFILLSKDEAPVPAPVAAAPQADVAAATTPIVSLGDPAARDSRRRVLGARKNPFKPAVKAKKAAEAESVTSTAPTTPPAGSPEAPTGGSGVVPGVVTPGVTPVRPKRYETWSLFVRFGEASDQRLTGIRNLRRLKALPSVLEPVVIYLGLLQDRKTAVFLVDAGVKVQGDGDCHPDPANCQTLHLKRGETSFFDVIDSETGEAAARYQLDLVKIKQKTTDDASKARAARRAEAKGGRDALRARQSRIGKYRYDARTGVVRQVD